MLVHSLQSTIIIARYNFILYDAAPRLSHPSEPRRYIPLLSSDSRAHSMCLRLLPMAARFLLLALQPSLSLELQLLARERPLVVVFLFVFVIRVVLDGRRQLDLQLAHRPVPLQPW